MCEYNMIPVNEMIMPATVDEDIVSPNNKQPPARIVTVLRWPTMLNVRLLVTPMSEKVEIDTINPRMELTTIAVTDERV